MKINFTVLFTLLVTLNHSFICDVNAQNKNNDALIAAAGIIGVAATSAVLIEEYKEILESDAVDHILTYYPEFTEFRIKLLFENGQKFSDQGQGQALAFFLSTMDKSRKTGERNVMLRFLNDNFINEYGVKIRKVEYVIFGSKEWNSIMAFYANLMGSVDSLEISKNEKKIDYDFNIPLYSSSKCKDDLAIEVNHYNVFGAKSKKCYKYSNTKDSLKNLIFTKSGFTNGAFNKAIFPFYKLKGDDYVIGDYDNKFKIFGNEKTIGLYIKSMSKSILLKPSFVTKIHSFINFQEEIYSDFILEDPKYLK